MKSPALVVGLLVSILLASCASHKPAPVVDRSSGQGSATNGQKPAAADRVVPKGYYVVKEGDTLYRIALEHGQDYRDVAAWNQLENAHRISVGQEIRIAPPETEAAPVAVTRPIGAAPIIEKRSLDGNSETVKREPRAGREPYSDEAYAKAMKATEAMPRVEIKPEPKAEIRPEPQVEAKIGAKSGDEDVQWAWPANGKLLGQFVETGSKGLDIAGKAGDPVTAAADGKVVYSGAGLRGFGQLVIVKHNAVYLTAYAHNSKILVKEGQLVTRGQKVAEMGDTDADQVKLHFEVRRQGKPVDPLKHLPPR
jgi:lipoprotein NlpD